MPILRWLVFFLVTAVIWWAGNFTRYTWISLSVGRAHPAAFGEVR